MFRECLMIGVAFLFIVLLSVGSGCGKAKQKFKVPDIKMITSEYILAVEALRDQHVWIAGNFGVIFYSSDGGDNWTEQHSGVKNLLTDVDFVNSKLGWVSGIKGTMLHTSDGGANWTKQNPGTKRHILSISFVDKDYGWAVGEFSTIRHTTDGGQNWISQSEEQDKILSGVHFIDREHGWIVGEAGIILHTNNGGITWQHNMPKFFKRANIEEEYENPRPALFRAYFIDRDHGWLCGIDSTIIHTADGGKSWKVLNQGQDILYDIVIRDGRGWAVGSQGTYLLSRNGGMTWEVQEGIIKSKLGFAGVSFSTPDNGWVVGDSGTIVHTTDGGETWSFYSGFSYEIEWFEMPDALEKRVIE